ncbi:MAG: ABC transporter ATP-binding protein [Verrucomicrobiota bacterium]
MKKSKVGRLLGELKPYRSYWIVGTICLLVSAPGRLFHPLVWMFVIDRVVAQRETQWLWPALGLMVVVQGISLALGAAQGLLFEKAGQLFIRDLRNRLFQKLNRQSVGYLHNQRMGDLSSRVISDIQTVQSSLVNGMGTMCDELVSFVFVIGIILSINWMIGLFVIVPLVLTFVIMRVFNARLKAYYHEASRVMGQVSARLQDSLSGHPIIQAFGMGDREEGRFKNETETHFQATMKAVRLRTALFPGVFFLGFLTNVIMLGVGVGLVLQEILTLGGLVAIRIYWWQLNSPMRTLATVGDLLQRARASSQRIYEVLDAPDPTSDPVTPTMLSHAMQPIVFESVSFHYDAARPVLRNLNLCLEPKTRVVLAGMSGGGKTTLLNLLLRFYEPISGRIRCGSVYIDEMTRAHWRSFVAPVFQETFLFHCSIRENLRYACSDATDKQMQKALAQANAWEFVKDTPQGLDTIVGERGIKLSGGQRQRLGIARAFLANPSILLLDEPTSSVEPESENIIVQSIHELMEGRTVIMTSHRVSLFQKADRILFLNGGQIEEDGSHSKLLEGNGSYSKLYRSWEAAEQAELLNQ